MANLRIEKARMEGERKAVEAGLGPIRYLATLIGSTDEQTMRWFILVVALLLDPAAVLLLLAATERSTFVPVHLEVAQRAHKAARSGSGRCLMN